MELWNTTERNIEAGRDLVVPTPLQEPYWVKAKITRVLDG